MAREASNPPPDGGEGFLARWSRRKTADSTASPASGAPAPASVPAAEPVAEPSPPLPALESLTAESDYTVFMRPGVPDALRRDALRRLWTSVPALAPVEIAEAHMADFNAVPTFPDGLKATLYDVARGLVDGAESTPAEQPVERSAADDQARGTAPGGDGAEPGGSDEAAGPPLA